MNTVLIARFKNKKEADLAAKLLKKSGSQSIVTTEENLEDMEDMYLARLIDEGMQEEGEIPLEEFKKFLDEKIASLDK